MGCEKSLGGKRPSMERRGGGGRGGVRNIASQHVHHKQTHSQTTQTHAQTHTRSVNVHRTGCGVSTSRLGGECLSIERRTGARVRGRGCTENRESTYTTNRHTHRHRRHTQETHSRSVNVHILGCEEGLGGEGLSIERRGGARVRGRGLTRDLHLSNMYAGARVYLDDAVLLYNYIAIYLSKSKSISI